MGEVNIALDFQGIKWYGLYIIKAAYVFLYPTRINVLRLCSFHLARMAFTKRTAIIVKSIMMDIGI